MGKTKLIVAGVCLLAAAAAAPFSTHAQTCQSSQDAAVKCFVGYAVRTNLMALRYGMTLKQFQTYGVSVSKILQSQQTYLVTLGITSAVSDAMPPTNADGSPNVAAQQTAMNAIVDAEVANGLVPIPQEVDTQDLKWFSLDLVTSMDANSGMLLSPGLLLRIVDSYVVASTSNGSVNWILANATLSAAVDSFSKAGLLKLPSTITVAQLKQFVNALALAIYNYKVATGRTSL